MSFLTASSPSLPLPFIQGRENMASAANHGAPRPATSPFESLHPPRRPLSKESLPFGTLQLTNLGPLVSERPPPTWGDPVGGGGRGCRMGAAFPAPPGAWA